MLTSMGLLKEFVTKNYLTMKKSTKIYFGG